MTGVVEFYYRGVNALSRVFGRQSEQTDRRQEKRRIYELDLGAICLAVQQSPLEQMVLPDHVVEVDSFTYQINGNNLGFLLETKKISERDKSVEKKIKADFMFFNYLCQGFFGENKELIMNDFGGLMGQNMGFGYNRGPIVNIRYGRAMFLRESEKSYSVMLNTFGFCCEGFALFSEILKYNNREYGVKIKFSPEVEEQVQGLRNRLSLLVKQEESK